MRHRLLAAVAVLLGARSVTAAQSPVTTPAAPPRRPGPRRRPRRPVTGGTRTPWVDVMAGCEQGPVYFTFKPTFRVLSGPLLSNGPFVPFVRVDDSVPGEGDDPSAGQWFIGLADDCVWPKDGGWFEAHGDSRVAHRFPGPGTYTVTVTVYTAGCDGRDVQHASRSMTWTV